MSVESPHDLTDEDMDSAGCDCSTPFTSIQSLMVLSGNRKSYIIQPLNIYHWISHHY